MTRLKLDPPFIYPGFINGGLPKDFYLTQTLKSPSDWPHKGWESCKCLKERNRMQMWCFEPVISKSIRCLFICSWHNMCLEMPQSHLLCCCWFSWRPNDFTAILWWIMSYSSGSIELHWTCIVIIIEFWSFHLILKWGKSGRFKDISLLKSLETIDICISSILIANTFLRFMKKM